jgi:translation initiation factor 1
MDLDNLDKKFAFDDDDLVIKKVYIKYVKRNGAKCITLVEGLENDLDIKALTKTFKKKYNCNGSIQKDQYDYDVIQLSGDQRYNIKNFLIEEEINKESEIIVT